MAAHSFDRHRQTSRCRRIVQPDRLTAEGVRIGLEIWEKATRKETNEIEFVIFRCKRCWNLHISRRRIAPSAVPAPIVPQERNAPPVFRRVAPSALVSSSTSRSDDVEDIRYLIEEFDLG